MSPFISLPTANTLPYTYKAPPSTLPPSSTGSTSTAASGEKPKYIVSSSGHAAHPDDIIASCQALKEHLQKMQDDAERELREWDERIRQRELAEKRRVAPGWLDRDERILEPEKKDDVHPVAAATTSGTLPNQMSGVSVSVAQAPALGSNREGEELDRAFGGLALR